MPGKLGVSIVGAGYWGPNLVRNFFNSPDWAVVSVVDRDMARIGKITRQFPSLESYDNIEAVLCDERVDAVVIATPVETHFALAKAALLANKHVIIEKPMTHTVAEAEELCRIAEMRGLTLMVDHTFLYTGSVEMLRNLVQDGALGEVLYLDSVRVNLGLFQNTINVLYDLAPHDISIFNYILDEYPSSVSAQVAHCIHDDMADVAFLTLKYPSGVLAHAHLSWLSPVKMRRLTVAGRTKMATWDDVEPSEKIRIYDKGVDLDQNVESRARRMVSYRTGDMHAPAVDGTEALAKVVTAFYQAITSGVTPRSSSQDGLAVVRVLEATNKSIESSGASIPISEEILV